MKIFSIQLSLITVLLLLLSCERLDDDYNKIPDDIARLAELQQEYQDALVANTDGWFMEYQPGENNPAVPIFMKFFENGDVTMVSDRVGFDEEQTSTYRVGGVIGPELIFDTYSVYSSIAETGGGSFDFRMFPQEDGSFKLKHATGDLDTEFLLRKASANDKDEIIARAEVGYLLKEFNENSSAYFRNLILDEVSAFWELDIVSQQLTLTWEDGGGENQTETFAYTTLAGNGIKLVKPWKPQGSVQIDEIYFGDVTSEGILIDDAGEGGAGKVEVSHVPAVPYKGTAEKYIFSNSLKMNENPVRLLAYTSNIDAVSNELRPYYEAVTNALPSFWRIQVYNYSPVDNPRNAIVLVGKNENDANTFHYFYYGMTIKDDSHVALEFENANELGSQIENHPDVIEFFNKIYPPEGITIIPLAAQRIRVVSRVNSLYYMDLIVSTPPGLWND